MIKTEEGHNKSISANYLMNIRQYYAKPRIPSFFDKLIEKVREEGKQNANIYEKSLAFFYDVLDEIEWKHHPDSPANADNTETSKYPSRIICEGMIKRATALSA